MKALEEKIVKQGTCIGSEVLKVDTFINHGIDTKFLDDMGKEIARIFAGDEPTKILTAEASGIAIAVAAANHLNYIPVVFAKKNKPNTMGLDVYESSAKSFTKGSIFTLRVTKELISKDDRILIVDDFLAHGQAALALYDIATQAGAKVVGCTAVIEKKYQGGSERVRKLGVHVQSLAVIEKMEDGKITFE